MKTRTQTASIPIAVLIADVHFNIKTVDVASNAFQQAYDYANDTDLPLIIAGDLHDTKANVRGECINAINNILSANQVEVIVLVGNHDLINEKATENALGFIKNATIVTDYLKFNNMFLMAYQSDIENYKKIFAQNKKNCIVICHQGLTGSNMGEYIQDKSAVSINDVSGHRIISGHYHTRQTIELPNNGQWDYIGNPYTLTYGEANDPEKGFQVLYEDGSLEFIPTNLRKHIVIDLVENEYYQGAPLDLLTPDNFLKIKIQGKKDTLCKITKDSITKTLHIKIPFKLELIHDKIETKTVSKTSNQTEVLDSLIQSATGIEESTKQRLKDLWKSYAS